MLYRSTKYGLDVIKLEPKREEIEAYKRKLSEEKQIRIYRKQFCHSCGQCERKILNQICFFKMEDPEWIQNYILGNFTNSFSWESENSLTLGNDVFILEEFFSRFSHFCDQNLTSEREDKVIILPKELWYLELFLKEEYQKIVEYQAYLNDTSDLTSITKLFHISIEKYLSLKELEGLVTIGILERSRLDEILKQGQAGAILCKSLWK